VRRSLSVRNSKRRFHPEARRKRRKKREEFNHEMHEKHEKGIGVRRRKVWEAGFKELEKTA